MDRTSRSLNCSCRHQGSSERPVASGRGSQKTQTPIARSRDAGRAPRRVWRSGRYSVRRVHAVGASEEDEANLPGHDRGAPPVVQVVLQVPISDAELELLEQAVVVEDVERVEDVKLVPLREDERVADQLLDRRLVREVVVAVGRVQLGVLLVLEHRRGERVEGEHVRHLLLAILAGLLDDVGVDDALARHEPVRELRLGELRRQLVPPQVGVELGAAGGDVLLLEGSHALGDRLVGERVELERAHHCHARGEAGEADFDELLWVERAVPVAAARDRPRQHHPGRVGRLEDALLVDAAGDLSDEHRSEPLRAQLLVHAEEVHLDHRLVAELGRAAAAARSRARCAAVQVEARQLLLNVDAARAGAALALLRLVGGRRRARLDPLAVAEEVGRGGADEGDQLLRLRHPHAHMPVVERAGRLHRPADKVERVVKAEHGVAILDVVFVQ
mmetsp:Transcript_22427/g.63649  ORF Transcript_22427/g.63649 Transcript_22427/m.63649 type:complete len:446 (+) Transcript_22427:202-1539(+)